MRDQTAFSLRDGMELAGVDLEELWWRYVAIGGSRDAASVAMDVLGAHPCDEREHDLIAQALNETFLDQGQDSFPVGYSAVSGSATFPRLIRRSAGSVPMSRSLHARQQAAVARLRSAAAARQAAALHATAARLMHTSGQLQFARRADARASAARQRGARSLAA